MPALAYGRSMNRSGRTRATVAATIAACGVFGLGGYVIGHAGGPNIAHAQRAGSTSGEAAGGAKGAAMGTAAGYGAGESAAYRSAYPQAYRLAYRKAVR
jgi:hypothetical protein